MLQPKDRQKYNEEKKKGEPPVYEVIADYPGNKDFPVGRIFSCYEWNSLYWAYSVTDCQGTREYLSTFFDKYPHIFKKTS